MHVDDFPYIVAIIMRLGHKMKRNIDLKILKERKKKQYRFQRKTIELDVCAQIYSTKICGKAKTPRLAHKLNRCIKK